MPIMSSSRDEQQQGRADLQARRGVMPRRTSRSRSARSTADQARDHEPARPGLDVARPPRWARRRPRSRPPRRCAPLPGESSSTTARAGCHAQQGAGAQVGLGVGLGQADLVARHHGVEGQVELGRGRRRRGPGRTTTPGRAGRRPPARRAPARPRRAAARARPRTARPCGRGPCDIVRPTSSGVGSCPSPARMAGHRGLQAGADDLRLELGGPGAAQLLGELGLRDRPGRLGVDEQAVHVEQHGGQPARPRLEQRRARRQAGAQ